MGKLSKEELTQLVKEIVTESVEPLKQSQESYMKDILAQHKEPQKREPGQIVGRMVRALVAGKGDPERAAHFAKKRWDDDEVSKALTTGDADSGGFLVPEQQSSEIIELLRPASVIRRMNPVIMPMPNGTMTIPRLAGGGTASYIGESQAQNATEETFEQLRLTWKKLRAIVPVSNELLATSSPSADMIVRDDLVAALATREDQAFIRDDGTQHKPKGLRYWAPAANVTASNGTTSAQVEQDFQELIQALEGSNVRMLRPGILMAPRSKNYLVNLRDANGNLIFPELRTPSPTLYGMPVAWTNNIPTNLGGGTESEVYIVDFADAVIGEMSQLIIEISNEASYQDQNGNLVSAFARDETVVKAIQRHDFVMRHDASVAIKTGVTWGV